VTGQFRYTSPTSVRVGAHRASWILTNGPIPEGQHVLHRCDNPPCVRPQHLWLGIELDNAHDRQAKGRGVRPRSGSGRHGRQDVVLHPRRPKSARIRQNVLFTLSHEAREHLENLARLEGRSMSSIVEEIILTEYAKSHPGRS
jgi:hypothetical protein